jgi:hypothetical protein
MIGIGSRMLQLPAQRVQRWQQARPASSAANHVATSPLPPCVVCCIQAEQQQLFARWQELSTGRKSWTPLIAAVNGIALGGGAELAMLCDVIIASTAASFGLVGAGRCCKRTTGLASGLVTAEGCYGELVADIPAGCCFTYTHVCSCMLMYGEQGHMFIVPFLLGTAVLRQPPGIKLSCASTSHI